MSKIYIGNIQIVDDDIEILERLLEVDGKNGSLFIYDPRLREGLRQHGYVKANNIGWLWGTERLKSLLPKLKQSLGNSEAIS